MKLSGLHRSAIASVGRQRLRVSTRDTPVLSDNRTHAQHSAAHVELMLRNSLQPSLPTLKSCIRSRRDTQRRYT